MSLGHPIGEPLPLSGVVDSAAVSPDDARIACGRRDGTIQIWDLNTGQSVGIVLAGHEGMVYSLAFSPDGRRVVSVAMKKYPLVAKSRYPLVAR